MKAKKRKRNEPKQMEHFAQFGETDAAGLVDEKCTELLAKLHDFGRTNRLIAIENMAYDNLKDAMFTIGDEIQGSCRVQCPLCPVIYSCKYIGTWKTSNVFKHFRTHQHIDDSNANKENEINQMNRNTQSIELVQEHFDIENFEENYEHDNIQMNVQSPAIELVQNPFDTEDFNASGSLSRTITLCIQSLDNHIETPTNVPIQKSVPVSKRKLRNGKRFK